jgi:hypothetical protein
MVSRMNARMASAGPVRRTWLEAGQGPVRRTWLEPGEGACSHLIMTKRCPFKYFKTSSEIIRLAVMMYVRFLLRTAVQ